MRIDGKRCLAATAVADPARHLRHVDAGRVKVIGGLPGEQSCLSLVWTGLDRGSKGWRGLTMTPRALRHLQDLRREILGRPAPQSATTEVVAAA